MTPTITLSPEASVHLTEELEGRVLRIAFTTGCGGSGYRLSFADTPGSDDVVLQVGGVPIALDDMAASRLDGALIAFDAHEGGYLLEHPDAATAVWCG